MASLDALSAEIDNLMADLSIVAGPPMPSIAPSYGAPAMNGGPAGAASFGPGAASFGPGAAAGASFGPGAASFGPGVRASVGGPSFGPGAGGPSFGPGGGGASFGPGAAPRPSSTMAFGPGGASTGPGPRDASSGPGVSGMATHTPDGRPIQFNGPPCGHCGEVVIGKVVNALGKTWHPEHFVCCTCSQPFPGGKFVEHEGKPYCEEHYWELCAPRCFACQQPVREGVIKALGRVYHPTHFTCQGCGIGLAGTSFKEAGGEPYCGECKKNIQVAIDPTIHICAKCKKPITGEYVLLFGQRMHPEHFQCDMCGKDLRNGDCHEYQGKNYCYEDYLKLQTSMCAGCRKPIVGRSVTGMGRVWHPEHFCCAHCHTPFAGSQFYEKNGLPYCEEHYKQLFGRPCSKCDLPVVKNGVEALGKIWHREHFVCQHCDDPLNPEGKICQAEGKPLCKRCYLKLPGKMRGQIEKQQLREAKMEKRIQKDQQREARRAELEAKKAAKAAAKEKS